MKSPFSLWVSLLCLLYASVSNSLFAILFRELTLSEWSHYAFIDKDQEASGVYIHLPIVGQFLPTDWLVLEYGSPAPLAINWKKILGYDLYSRFPYGIRLKLPSARLGLKLNHAWSLSLCHFYHSVIGFFWKHSFVKLPHANPCLGICFWQVQLRQPMKN